MSYTPRLDIRDVIPTEAIDNNVIIVPLFKINNKYTELND
jgi:hypothetical protein